MLRLLPSGLFFLSLYHGWISLQSERAVPKIYLIWYNKNNLLVKEKRMADLNLTEWQGK